MMMAELLKTDFAYGPTYDPEELRVAQLSDDEYQAELDKEQAEAEAWAAARAGRS